MIRIMHAATHSDGTHDEHVGDMDTCPESECQWPRVRGLVTVTGVPERTGVLEEKRRDGSVVVRINDTFVIVTDLCLLRRTDHGMYCPHGIKIVDEGDSCYDDFRGVVDPWPCQEVGCTRENFENGAQEYECALMHDDAALE